MEVQTYLLDSFVHFIGDISSWRHIVASVSTSEDEDVDDDKSNLSYSSSSKSHYSFFSSDIDDAKKDADYVDRWSWWMKTALNSKASMPREYLVLRARYIWSIGDARASRSLIPAPMETSRRTDESSSSTIQTIFYESVWLALKTSKDSNPAA